MTRPRPRSVALIGNAPDPIDRAAEIDAHDIVVRINKAAGFGGPTGSRVDELVLVNSGGQMEEWLRLGSIETAPVFAAARTVRLPLHPRKIDHIRPRLSEAEREAAARDDYTDAARERFTALGKRVRLTTPGHYRASLAALGNTPYRRETPAPSTGLVMARWWCGLMARGLPLRLHVYNFGFEGWSGHDFSAERRWFENAYEAGLLTLHRGAKPRSQASRSQAARSQAAHSQAAHSQASRSHPSRSSTPRPDPSVAPGAMSAAPHVPTHTTFR